jgi:hypothetical protein
MASRSSAEEAEHRLVRDLGTLEDDLREDAFARRSIAVSPTTRSAARTTPRQGCR